MEMPAQANPLQPVKGLIDDAAFGGSHAFPAHHCLQETVLCPPTVGAADIVQDAHLPKETNILEGPSDPQTPDLK